MLTINVVTLFPEMFAAPLGTSIPGRAAQQGLVRYRVVQLRDYTHDRHKTVDDYAYGGGAGMVLNRSRFSRRSRTCASDRRSCCYRPAVAHSGTTTRCASPSAVR